MILILRHLIGIAAATAILYVGSGAVFLANSFFFGNRSVALVSGAVLLLALCLILLLQLWLLRAQKRGTLPPAGEAQDWQPLLNRMERLLTVFRWSVLALILIMAAKALL